MKLISGAVLFFVLIGSSLQAFDGTGKVRQPKRKSQWITGRLAVPRCGCEREVEKKFMACPMRSWPKSICGF